MRDITYTTRRQLSGIHIVPQGDLPSRLIFEGSIVNISDGAPLQTFREDVTDKLLPDQAAKVSDLVALAQTWLDAQVPA